jgi:hypothetical protein
MIIAAPMPRIGFVLGAIFLPPLYQKIEKYLSVHRMPISKSPYHTFPPAKGIGERISAGMITEQEAMSRSKEKRPQG